MFELGKTKEETLQKVKDTVVAAVERLQGCKATELASLQEIALLPFENDFPTLIDSLVKEGRLCEVEYVLPSLSFRIKSFLLPAGTKVTV